MPSVKYMGDMAGHEERCKAAGLLQRSGCLLFMSRVLRLSI